MAHSYECERPMLPAPVILKQRILLMAMMPPIRHRYIPFHRPFGFQEPETWKNV